jgi:hypothetical protein
MTTTNEDPTATPGELDWRQRWGDLHVFRFHQRQPVYVVHAATCRRRVDTMRKVDADFVDAMVVVAEPGDYIVAQDWGDGTLGASMVVAASAFEKEYEPATVFDGPSDRERANNERNGYETRLHQAREEIARLEGVVQRHNDVSEQTSLHYDRVFATGLGRALDATSVFDVLVALKPVVKEHRTGGSMAMLGLVRAYQGLAKPWKKAVKWEKRRRAALQQRARDLMHGQQRRP